MKIIGTLTLTAALLVTPTAAVAAPSGATRPVPAAALADRNADRISDGLQASLAGASQSDRFDVVVNTTVANPAAYARARVGAFRVYEQYTIIRGFHATMTKAQILGLARSPHVLRIEENFRVKTQDVSQNDFGTAAARADFPVTGAGVGFCLTDTGADPNHEQLNGGKIAGWHDFINNQPSPYDDHGHGTHVLSTAVGDGTGGSLALTYEGVAPGATAYVAKVLDSSGSGTDAQVVSGVQWCASNPAVRVISMSIGTPDPSDGQDAISQAVESAILTNGKVVVVAAGNSGDDTQTVGSPGAAQDAITVGSVAKYSAPAGYHTDGIYLSSFSSRGPTLDGRIKPDVVSPGERTVAAEAGTTQTYVEMTGTSMATPFVAGVVTLALDANPALTPAQVKALVMGTAQDRGPAGVDNDWGAGLIDGYAVVAAASGASSYQPTAFPTHEYASANVPSSGQWTYQFTLGPNDLSVPIAVTILIDGSVQCVYGFGGFCFQYAWSPDLDAELIAPDGTSIAQSTCPLNCDFNSVGHQETLAITPTMTGTYTVRVYPFDSGGTIHMDLSHGPLASTSPPPTNHPPVATGDSYTTAYGTALTVAAPGVLGNDSDPDGDPISAVLQTGPSNGTLSLNANGSFTYTPNSGYSGNDSFTYVANDGQASSSAATVAITVQPPPNQAPVAANDAYSTAYGSTLGVAAPGVLGNDSDPDGDSITASLQAGPSHGTVSLNADGSFVYAPASGYSGPDSFTYTANDGQASSNIATVTITVGPPPPPPSSLHIGDLDASKSSTKNGWKVTVTITVHNQSEATVSGVAVSFRWADGSTGSCTAKRNGTCSASKSLRSGVTSTSLTVTNVTGSSPYDATLNHDPDGDSNGTTIAVTKP
ncbi:MAG: S8 family serine peptidase [Actinomycetota bacterium]